MNETVAPPRVRFNPPPRPGPTAGRGNRPYTTAEALRFAFENPDSEGASRYGTTPRSREEIDDITSRVATATGEDGRSRGLMDRAGGFLGGLWDMIATFFKCLMGTFSGECSFRDFGRLRGERGALREATRVYEALNPPRREGESPHIRRYSPEDAAAISGVEPDGSGNYRPVRTAEGRHNGIYAREMDRAANGASYVQYQDMAARGQQPNEAQNQLFEQKFQAEVQALYQRQDIQALIARHGNDRRRFMADPIMQREIRAMADRLVQDEEINAAGSFNFSSHASYYAGRMRIRMEEIALPSPGTATVTPAPTPGPAAQIGLRGNFTSTDLAAAMRAADALIATNPSGPSGTAVLRDTWAARIYDALGPNAGNRRAISAEIATGITELYRDGSFAGLPVEQQVSAMEQRLNGRPLTDAQKTALRQVFQELAPKTRDALSNYTPLFSSNNDTQPLAHFTLRPSDTVTRGSSEQQHTI